MTEKKTVLLYGGRQFGKTTAKRIVDAEILLSRALPYLESHNDQGPTGEGWQSEELERLTALIKSFLEAKKPSQG